jgi:uncharacterized protein with ParB-like and HNH nuclease domain
MLLNHLIDPEVYNLALPTYQRDFVWNNPEIAKFLDSIFRGFPLGSIVLYKTDYDKSLNSSKRFANFADEVPKDGPILLVIDGQQRITTLRIALNPKSGKFAYFDVSEGTFEVRNSLRKAANGKILVKDVIDYTSSGIEHFFEKHIYGIKLRDDKEKLVQKLIQNNTSDKIKLIQEEISKLENEENNIKAFARSWKSTEINVLKYEEDAKHNIEYMRKLYTAINKSGKKLTFTESYIIPTLYSIDDSLHKKIEKILDDDKVKNIKEYIQNRHYIHELIYEYLNTTEKINTASTDDIKEAFDIVHEGLFSSIKILSQMGIDSEKKINYMGSLSAMIYSLGKNIQKNKKEFPRRKSITLSSNMESNAKFYFLMCNTKERYNSAQNGIANQKSDLAYSINKNDFFDYIRADYQKKYKNGIWYKKEEVEKAKYGKGKRPNAFLIFLSILEKQNGAWNGEQTSESELLLIGSQQHHIFPESKYRDDPEVNSISNITFVSPEANKQYGDNHPSVYLNSELMDTRSKENFINKRFLKDAEIDKRETEFNSSFRSARVQLLVTAMNEYINKLID